MDFTGLNLPDWFGPLCEEIERELARLSQTENDRRPAIVKEIADLRETIRGWSISLAKPELNPAVREDLEVRYADAKASLRELESALEGLEGQAQQKHKLLDPKQVLERMNRLAEVLASGNVTFGNLELGRHIDRIAAYPDGRVVMRTNKLGVFEGASVLLSRSSATATEPSVGAPKKVLPRRRGRLRTEDDLTTVAAHYQDDLRNLDPKRFSDLGPEWFWEDTLEVPKPTYWAAEYAAEVVRLRADGMTIEKLAAHFGKTPPTIRKALRIGAKARPEQQLPRKIAAAALGRSPRRRGDESQTAGNDHRRNRRETREERYDHSGRAQARVQHRHRSGSIKSGTQRVRGSRQR